MQPLKQDRNFILVILLSIITCGIYGIYYWYKFTEDLNTLGRGDGQESPNYIIVLLLSSITCGIYAFFWYYKQGNRMQAIGQRNGGKRHDPASLDPGRLASVWSRTADFLLYDDQQYE